MPDFKYGDLVCYRGATPHDEPLMYIGECQHWREGQGLIDLFDLTGEYLLPDRNISHKSPVLWEKCWHVSPWTVFDGR